MREGQIVHFVLPDGPETQHGTCREALVGRHTETTEIADLLIFRHPKGHALAVMTEDGDKEVLKVAGALFRRAVPHDPGHEFGSWHLPSECHHKEG